MPVLTRSYQRHAPSPKKVEFRQLLLPALNEILQSSHSENRFQIIDISPDCYSKSTEESSVHIAWKDTRPFQHQSLSLPEYALW